MSNPAKTLLIVDDDAAMREMLASLFREHGYPVHEAASVDDALECARDQDVDAVLSDVRMPGRSGVDLVGELRGLRPGVPVVLMTAFGSVASAVDAMRAGAADYITKPFEPDVALITVERVLERRVLEEENRQLRRAVDASASLGDLRGKSAALADIVALIKKVAGGRSSVLITGESGTGKEVVARTLHFHGARADAPFVPINCTALPEGLLESELFGHVRGAFTGAHTSKRGLFEKADGGTLFLDEIGDMGPTLQGKLLRVLQDQEIRPVGGTTATKVDVRIVAATNKDLEEEIAAGRFREDLYYRLNVIPIHLPPLRERPEDIPALVDTFLARHASGDSRSVTPAAMRRLCAQPWRGNARELENFIERTLALCDTSEIDVADLRFEGDLAAPGGDALDTGLHAAAGAGITLDELQERYTELVLERNGGNKLRTAKQLGIDRKTLYRRAERRKRA